MLTQNDILQNRYRIEGLLGRGGMGSVYRAWDTRLNVPVAIKEMEAQPNLEAEVLDELRQQFQQEATTLARLTHPNLVGVTDFFQERRNVYLVMKYVDGESLAERIRREGAVSEAQVLLWAQQLLDAMAYCHGQGVIHRDIKPQNIIVDAAGNAILVDFGLVKLWDPGDPSTRTAVRGLGTPQYAPPEQYEVATGHTEPASDVYSLGATLYHALTGQAPPTATMRVAEPEQFAPVRSLRPGISAATADAIERAMALARSKRWASAREMANALGLAIRPWERAGRADARTDVLAAGATIAISESPATKARPATGPPARARRGFPYGALAIIAALFFTGTFAVAALEFMGVLNLGVAAMLRPNQPQVTPSATPTRPGDQGATKSPVALVSNVTTATATPTLTPLPTDTPSPTETPSPTARPTSTPRPSPTPRPSATPTSEATATPTAEATDTPAPASSPTATPTASATPEPAASTGALVGFEVFGTWRRGDQPNGELTQTTAQVKAGTYAAQLDYSFPASGDDYVVFNQTRALGATPNHFAIWVYGDGSGHFLNLWVEDAQGEVWSVAMGTVGSAGWRQLTGQLAPGLAWPSGHISGPDNGRVDYPVAFAAIVLDRPATGPLQGRIYLDELTAWTGTVTAPTAAPTEEAVSSGSPTATAQPSAQPPGELGRILLTVQTSEGSLLYTTDPSWTQMSELGRIDPNATTCNAGLSSVSTLSGQTYNVVRYSRCAVTERTDACTSPDGNYKLITNFLPGWNYSVLLQEVATATDSFIYQGKLTTAAGVQWDNSSRYVYLGIGGSIQVVSVATQQLQQAIAGYEEGWPPQFSPDGTQLLYLKPSGGQGNADAFLVGVNGANERNLTNAPGVTKRCPVWRR